MSSPASKTVVEEQPTTTSPVSITDGNLPENAGSPSIQISNVESVSLEGADNEKILPLSNPMDEIDTDGEDRDDISPISTVVPSNTPVTGDSGQGSPNMQSSTESLIDDVTLKSDHLGELLETPLPQEETAERSAGSEVPESLANNVGPQVEDALSQVSPPADSKNKVSKATKKEEKKEEKKKSKKKEDKSIDYILRALNSLHSPEEKLAALCKKYADLHEEHRVLQTSFKTQQRTIAVVMREKDQLQSEHTKAMMAKSKLESLCRELQKHNKIIKDESIKRAKEDDEKRKEISAQFNHTIVEIQTQMTDNSERNSKLRQENENLAAQLKSFIKQCEVRDLQVEKLREQHDLERKLADAKMNQAQAIIKEHEENGIKERELLLLKLAESGKKNQILEAQVNMFKERYDEFEKLHTRSSETFQKYKTEMDKMTKRIKKLEKDGLQWKTKWEGTNKALIEQIEARSKSEKESLLHIQKTKKLESLCRALQAELHGKKIVDTDNSKTETEVNSTVPANSAVAESTCGLESSQAPQEVPPVTSPSPPSDTPSNTSQAAPSVIETGATGGSAPVPAKDSPTPPEEATSNCCAHTAPDCGGDLEEGSPLASEASTRESLPEADQSISVA